MSKPVYLHKLRMKSGGTFKPILGITKFDREISATVKTWKPFDLKGYDDAMRTGMSEKLVSSLVFDDQDELHMEIAALIRATLKEAEKEFEWEDPTGDVYEFTAVVNVTKLGGGETEDEETLDFELYPKGVPTLKTDAASYED